MSYKLNVDVEQKGRDGFVIVTIDGKKFKWYWEFGVEEYLAYIKVPTPNEWESLPISIYPRDNVLSAVADAVCTMKCPGCKYEICFDAIIIKEN